MDKLKKIGIEGIYSAGRSVPPTYELTREILQQITKRGSEMHDIPLFPWYNRHI